MLPAADIVADSSATFAAAPRDEAPAWRLPSRIIFRFCVVYFGLYVATTQMLTSMILIPKVDVPEVSSTRWAVALSSWIARHVMHVSGEFVTRTTGSGDRTLDWAWTLALAALAIVGTIVWSLATRRRAHPDVQKWFRVFLRFALGATMLTYGFAKVFPLQMPAPSLQRLVEPYGSFSPMGVLWYSVGASPAYEIFVGSAEVAGGVLLMIPPLATLGALITLADVVEVFTLNMTYDVPVKLFSFHLILMALFLLAPEMRRILNVLVLTRTVGPSSQLPLFTKRRAMRAAIAVQFVLAIYLVSINAFGGWRGLQRREAATSPLFGIWEVAGLSTDGQPSPPLLTDTNRWRRVIFWQQPTVMSFQLMNDTFSGFACAIDANAHTVTLTKGPSDHKWKAIFSYARPDSDSMTLDGTMDARRIHAQLHRIDHRNFLLLSRGFHWVQEYPFNR